MAVKILSNDLATDDWWFKQGFWVSIRGTTAIKQTKLGVEYMSYGNADLAQCQKVVVKYLFSSSIPTKP